MATVSRTRAKSHLIGKVDSLNPRKLGTGLGDNWSATTLLKSGISSRSQNSSTLILIKIIYLHGNNDLYAVMTKRPSIMGKTKLPQIYSSLLEINYNMEAVIRGE